MATTISKRVYAFVIAACATFACAAALCAPASAWADGGLRAAEIGHELATIMDATVSHDQAEFEKYIPWMKDYPQYVFYSPAKSQTLYALLKESVAKYSRLGRSLDSMCSYGPYSAGYDEHGMPTSIDIKDVYWAPVSAKAYNGKKYKPVPKGAWSRKGYTQAANRLRGIYALKSSELVKGRDFTVKYVNSKGKKVTPKKKGSYKLVITGKGKFHGTKVLKFRIAKKSKLKRVGMKLRRVQAFQEGATDKFVYKQRSAIICHCGFTCNPFSNVSQGEQIHAHVVEASTINDGFTHSNGDLRMCIQTGVEHEDAIYATRKVLQKGYWK